MAVNATMHLDQFSCDLVTASQQKGGCPLRGKRKLCDWTCGRGESKGWKGRETMGVIK